MVLKGEVGGRSRTIKYLKKSFFLSFSAAAACWMDEKSCQMGNKTKEVRRTCSIFSRLSLKFYCSLNLCAACSFFISLYELFLLSRWPSRESKPQLLSWDQNIWPSFLIRRKIYEGKLRTIWKFFFLSFSRSFLLLF
jgi:hypothetical protein